MNKSFLAFNLLFFFFIGCLPKTPTVISKTKEMMGTVVGVQVVSPQKEDASFAIKAAFKEMKRIENIFSLWIPESEVSKLNREAWRAPIKVSKTLLELLKISLQISRETNGAFDITVMPLAKVWKDRIKQGSIPSRKKVSQLKSRVDYRKVKVDAEGRVKFLKRGMAVDFGAIAKGYAVDRASWILRQYGFKNFMVEAWGDIYASGTLTSRKWKIGVRHPRIENKLWDIVELKDQAIATSGDYEQYVDKAKRRYHHIIDPRTGYPAKPCVSVTVIDQTCTLADAYATAVFVMGPKEGLKFVQNKPHLRATIIVKSGKRLKAIEVGK